VADRDAERHPGGLEHAAPGRRRQVRGVLRGIELHLVLKAEPRPVTPEHQRGGQNAALDHALGPEDHRDARRGRGRADRRPGALEERRIRRGRYMPEATIPGNVAFRKAHQRRALGARLRDRTLHSGDRVLGRARVTKVGEHDTDRGHASR